MVAAGSGSRFGALKQFADLTGATVIERAVAAAAGCAEGVVLVLPDDAATGEKAGPAGGSAGADDTAGSGDEAAPAGSAVEVVDVGAELRTVPGAATRSGSVRCGLAAVPDGAEIVVVHDAARPLAAPGLFEAVIAAVRSGADAAVPAVPLVDTIRRRAGGTVDRDELAAVQTPQAFTAEALRRAHASGGEATDDAGLVESAGGTVVLVDGDPRNIKITTPSDLAVAAALLAAGPVSPAGEGPHADPAAEPGALR